MTSEHAFRVWVDAPYPVALTRVKGALRAAGFGALTEVDVKSTFAEKLGVAFRDDSILGACNPSLSHRALSQELEAGLVLPCNLAVHKEADGADVLIADPQIIVRTLREEDLEGIARQAERVHANGIIRTALDHRFNMQSYRTATGAQLASHPCPTHKPARSNTLKAHTERG